MQRDFFQFTLFQIRDKHYSDYIYSDTNKKTGIATNYS